MKTTRPIADRLLALADSMQKEIDHGRRPMTQNPTPKRMREYNSRMHDANNAERTQRALRAWQPATRPETFRRSSRTCARGRRCSSLYGSR